VLMGDIYMELEDYKNALKMYELADEIDRNEIDVLRKKGRVNFTLVTTLP